MEDEKKEPTEGIDAKFDWNSSFFRQCERIDNSASLGEFKKNIDLLECKLSPYIDDDYGVDVEKAFQKFLKEAKGYGEAGVPKDDMLGMEWLNLKARYSALMKLAFRQKVLPQKNIPKKVI